MTKYEVVIDELVAHTAIVEAENERDAFLKAFAIISNGPDTEYTTYSEGFTGSHTIMEAI